MVVIDLLFLPFQKHVEVLASERQKLGHRNNTHQEKGNNCGKATLYALRPKTMENRSPMV
jgi:hypothetical protein